MLLKFAVFAAVLLIVLFLFKSNKKNKSTKEVESDEVPAVEMKQDPVCGSYTEETTKFKVRLHDKIYYFCSEECKDKFIKEHTE